MSIFNKLQFDDIDSLANGVYITGEAVYNAPERDVEMISIPGRNGELARDNKRFHNIEVKYRAGVKGDKPEDFARTLRAFRSLMASKRGYCRLVDSYHPDEYRLAVFKDAIEVEPAARKRAGEFDLVFDCKPQRFLMSGEAAVEVTDGEEFFNPTPFEASPMIMAKGYGTLTVDGHEIEIQNVLLGEVELASGREGKSERTPFNSALINQGDIITTERLTGTWLQKSNTTITDISVVTPPTIGTLIYGIDTGTNKWFVQLKYDDLTFAADPDNDTWDSCTIRLAVVGGATVDVDIDGVFGVDLDDGEIVYHFQKDDSTYFDNKATVKHGIVKADSTVSALGDPTYIDCDLGEVYKIDSGSLISLNAYVDLGSDLPVLAPGNNLIEYDNTFTSVKIIPRWWLV